jgi:hypothetical protein
VLPIFLLKIKHVREFKNNFNIRYNGKIYGLNPEIAWNYGLSFTQKFMLFGKKADVTRFL